jgi:hypothetical protein
MARVDVRPRLGPTEVEGVRVRSTEVEGVRRASGVEGFQG